MFSKNPPSPQLLQWLNLSHLGVYFNQHLHRAVIEKIVLLSKTFTHTLQDSVIDCAQASRQIMSFLFLWAPDWHLYHTHTHFFFLTCRQFWQQYKMASCVNPRVPSLDVFTKFSTCWKILKFRLNVLKWQFFRNFIYWTISLERVIWFWRGKV